MSFDPYAAEYDAHLTRGLSLSGEGKEFFARGRLVAAARYLRQARIVPRRIVEFGCGIGTNLGILAEMWPESEVIGLDQSRESLRIARSLCLTERIRLMTPEDYPAHGASAVDWVFCNGVFHHIPVHEHGAVLRTIISMLRPGGALTIFENNPFNPGARWVMKRIPFDRDARMIVPYVLGRRMRRAGLDSVRCEFLFVFPRFASAFRPLERYLARLPLGAQYGALGVRPTEADATTRDRGE